VKKGVDAAVGVAGLKRSWKEETAVLQNSYYILGVFFFFPVCGRRRRRRRGKRFE
jgi:hypothetical protein